MKAPEIDAAVERIEGGDRQPLYLVIGEEVLAMREAGRIAEALAAAAGCEVAVHKGAGGAELGSILADLFTYSLFEPAKIALVSGSAIFADRDAAADLIDEAAKAVVDDSGAACPLGDPLSSAERVAAGRLLQVLRLFGPGPLEGGAEEPISALPDWVLSGGKNYRKGGRRGRLKKQKTELRKGLAALLEAARAEDLSGWSEGNLAELDRAAEGGLPEGHALVLAERSVDRDHPIVRRLFEREAALAFDTLGLDRKGNPTGLDPIVAELARETGVSIDRTAAAELARRTLRKEGWGASEADAASAARFAAEYRKIAAGMPEGERRIDQAAVEESVVDRGEQDVWDVFNAMEGQKPGVAVAALRRYFDSAADRQGERFRFLSLLAGRCQQLAAVHGLAMTHGLTEARNYNGFKAQVLPKLMAEWPGTTKKPNPWPLFNLYKAAMARRSPEAVAAMGELPWKVLETEIRLRGGSGEADAALEALVLAVAGGGLPGGGNGPSSRPRDGLRAGPGARRSAERRGRRRR